MCMLERRVHLLLDEPRYRRVAALARTRGISVAAVIREAIEQTIPEEDADRLARQRRAFALAGAFDSSQRDTAERHDEVLSEQPRW